MIGFFYLLLIIALFILQIAIIVKFFQMAQDIREIKELFINKMKDDLEYRYYKCEEEEISREQYQATIDLLVAEKNDPKKQSNQEEVARKQREVAPEHWNKYCEIRDEVDKRAEEQARKELKLNEGQTAPGMCHTVWYYKKLILKKEYNIDWKSPRDLYPNIRFD